MKVLLDTSVLVAACVERHPRHLPAFEWLKKARAREIEALVSAHSLLETYSVLTRAPFKPRIGPEKAQKLIARNIYPHSNVVILTAGEYTETINSLAGKGFTGGMACGGLIVFCAEKAKAKKIVTSNTADFTRLAAAFGLDIEIVGL